MNDQQENRLSRAEKVEAFLLQHKADLAATPAITTTLQPGLTTAISKMRDDDEHAVADNTGYAEGKAETETSLENLADHIGSAIESYADDVDDFVLQNSVEFTLSQIQGFRDNRLLQYAQYVYDTATGATIKPTLIAEHNITDDDLKTLADLIKKYTGSTALPQQKKGETVAWGKLVDRDLAAIDVTLNKIRRKMNTYRYTNLFLFDAFTATDSVDDTGSHKTEEPIEGGATETVASFEYDAAKAISVENTGTTSLALQMYLNNVAVGAPIPVLPGNKLGTTLGNIAASGDELRLTNTGSTTGTYKFNL